MMTPLILLFSVLAPPCQEILHCHHLTFLNKGKYLINDFDPNTNQVVDRGQIVMEIQTDKALQDALKFDARFISIEHLLSNLAASILVSSGKSQADLDTAVKVTLESIRSQAPTRFHPEIANVATAEISQAVTNLYNLVNRHVGALMGPTRVIKGADGQAAISRRN